MKIGDRVFVCGYIDEIRKDTIIIRNAGGYFGTIPSEVMGELPSAKPERMTNGQWMDFRRSTTMKKISNVSKNAVKAEVKVVGKAIFVVFTSAAASLKATDAVRKATKCLPESISNAASIATGVATEILVEKYLNEGLLSEEIRKEKSLG